MLQHKSPKETLNSFFTFWWCWCVKYTKKGTAICYSKYDFSQSCACSLKYKYTFFLLCYFSRFFLQLFLIKHTFFFYFNYISKPAVNTGHRLFDKIHLNEIKGAQESSNTSLQKRCRWISKIKTKNRTKSPGIPKNTDSFAESTERK